mmetsp:Transcript_2824/g.7945  ORF Transcript_2824/g.7945 Transcript_2824/m.7945 type:complete len:198 (+) Transcript_2824:73-666(+)
MPSKNIAGTESAAMARSADDMLLQACSDGTSMASLERALKKKANVNAKKTTDGWTPLMLASQNWSHPQYIPFLKKLVAAKADVNAKCSSGCTALDYVEEQTSIWTAAREEEIKGQQDRRDIMEGKGPVGFGYGTLEHQRNTVIDNRPLVDELDTFKMLGQLAEGKKLLEDAGATGGNAPLNPAYLTTAEYIEKRDKL